MRYIGWAAGRGGGGLEKGHGNERHPDKTDVLYFRVWTVIVAKPHYKIRLRR